MTWPGARNHFDLGGLPLTDGGETASGHVWRSAAPEWMTTAGWQAAHRAGLATIVDLRNSDERGRKPEHPDINPSTMDGIAVVHAPTEDPDDVEFMATCGPWLDHPRSWAPNTEMYPEKFARVFTAIADSPGPLLIHCAGGKDRTGLVSAMLLQLAGATREAIVEGYVAGQLGWDETFQVEDRVPVAHEFLQTFDTAAYLTAAGVDDARIEKLRTLLRS